MHSVYAALTAGRNCDGIILTQFGIAAHGPGTAIPGGQRQAAFCPRMAAALVANTNVAPTPQPSEPPCRRRHPGSPVNDVYRSSATARERSSFKHLGHLQRLLPYVRRYAWMLALAILGLLLTRLAINLAPQLMRVAIDSLEDPNVIPNYKLPALGILVIAIVQAGIYVISRRALRRISIAVTYDLRKRLFHHIQRQGPNFFNRFDTGDLMSRAVNDVRMVRIAISFAWVQIVTVIFSVATSLYFMFDMSVKLAIWMLIPLPLVALVGFVMARGMFSYFRERQDAMAAVTSFTQENLNGIRTIQAMAQEDQEIKRFRRISTSYAQKFYRVTRYRQFMDVAMSALTTIAPLIILLYGGALVLEGELSLGAWAAFSSYLVMVTHSVSHIGWALSMFVAAAAGAERIYEILDVEPEVADKPRYQPPPVIHGHLEFRGFQYRHPGAPRPTIGGIDIRVDAGETVALLGRVGAGKSTILKAVVRLLDTPRGSIFLDGHDVCDFPLRRLRQLIALVPQEPCLFSATMRENLTYDDPRRGDAEIWDAVDAAGLANTLRDNLTDGLDSIVGERGITLSGGQKQRTTLARGLIRDTPVLLLDDCFSSVDTQTEEQILSGLGRLRNHKTTLLISHRVSTARHADRIYVIDNGRVRESGSHGQLLAKGGYYAELEAIQSNQDRDRSRKSALLHDLDSNADVPWPAAIRGDP